MAKCQWCEKELPTEGANVCGSCVFRPIEESLDDDDFEEEEKNKINFDMSILGEKKNPKSKRAAQLRADLLLNSLIESPESNQEIPMKIVKVKSNSIRGRAFVVDGELVLNFDEYGIARCLVSDLPTVKAYMKARPGRFTVVEEAKEASPKKVEKKAEKAERVERKASKEEHRAERAERKASKAEERKPKSEEPRPDKKAEKPEKKDAE